jgi:hypothetical protein
MSSLLKLCPLQVYDLFDDILLLANGRILFNGPRGQVTPHFATLGFEITGHKAEADFLQVRPWRALTLRTFSVFASISFRKK